LELVNSPTVQYHYFPKQKLSKANSLIQELVQGYGFIGDWVDQKIGKGTVIARRQPGRKATLPTKLLSQVAKTYNPNDSSKDPFIISSPEVLLKISPWSQNGIFITGIPPDAATSNFETLMGTLMADIYPNLKLFWLDDQSCFVMWDRKSADVNVGLSDSDLPAVAQHTAAVLDSSESNFVEEEIKPETSKDEELLNNLKELGWADQVIPVSISPLGGLTASDGQTIGQARKRNVTMLRGHVDTDWIEVASWRKYLIPLSRVATDSSSLID
jgi:hypothetical protein